MREATRNTINSSIHIKEKFKLYWLDIILFEEYKEKEGKK